MARIESRLEQDAQAWRDEVDVIPAVQERINRAEHGVVRRWAAPVGAGLVSAAVIAAAVIGLKSATGNSSQPATPVGSGANSAAPAPPTSASPDPLSPTMSPRKVAALPMPNPVPSLSAAQAQAQGLISMPWVLVSKPTGNSLDVYYVDGDGYCVGSKGVRVIETATSVEILMLSNIVHNDPVCADPLKVGRAVINLAKPLGSRQLLHGPVAAAWAVTGRDL